MATKTFGTSSSSGLTALVFSFGSDMLDADLATIRSNIKDDGFPAGGEAGVYSGNVWPDAFSRQGLLYVPNRGVLKVFPGDYVAVDTNSGWPILISAQVVGRGGTPWSHS